MSDLLTPSTSQILKKPAKAKIDFVTSLISLEEQPSKANLKYV
jgi:hypothetical protein